MTKEQYIKQKLLNQIDVGLAYEMYINTPHPTPKVPPQLFPQLFNMYFQMSGGDVSKYWEYYDKKFDAENCPVLIVNNLKQRIKI